MTRVFARPMPLVLILLFLTAIPIVAAVIRMVQIPMNALYDQTIFQSGGRA